jgi:hypothetical protein
VEEGVTDVKGELIDNVETRITCPLCGVTWSYEGDLSDHVVECPECDAELRVSCDGPVP